MGLKIVEHQSYTIVKSVAKTFFRCTLETNKKEGHFAKSHSNGPAVNIKEYNAFR